MLAYSKQLVTELVNSLPVKLIKFYERTKDNKPYPAADLQGIVEYCLENKYKGCVEKEELQVLSRELKKQKSKKKASWINAFESSLDYNVSDKKSPFYSLYQENNLLSIEKWEKLYGTLTLQQVIDEETKKVRLWSKSTDKYLIEYPLLSTKYDKYIVAAFMLDIANEIMNIAKDHFSGNFNSFFRTFPEELLELPLFSPTSYLLDIKKNQSKGLFEEFMTSETSFLRAEVKDDRVIDENVKLRALDSVDQKVLGYILTFINDSCLSDRTVLIPFIDIVKIIYPDVAKPSKNHYQQALKRCLKLTMFSYTNYDESLTEGFSFNILDNIVIDGQDEKKMAHVTYGTIPYNAVVNERVIKVTSKNYNSLEGELSILLYYALQKERLLLYYSATDTNMLKKTYRISSFKRWVRFRATNSKIISMVQESLNEFVDKKIAIESYEYSNGIFEIKYLTLTDDEKKDFQELSLLDNTKVI